MKNGLTFYLSFLTVSVMAQYNGTGSVTQGSGDTTVLNLYTCPTGRITNLGSITATDNSVWPLPAAVSFSDPTFPSSSDLYNSCVGATYATTAAAVSALSGNDIVTVDAGGDVYTAFVFADNYFEMYVNGVPVGKDNVPYTPFNSSIVRFRAFRPFTVAVLLVDWEEHLGLGYETNATYTYYAGDGGLAMMIKDASNQVIAISDSNWKAQTYYTAPITDLTCPTESGNLRLSNNCSAPSTNNGGNDYGLHWPRPSNWYDASFNDTSFPQAFTFSNTTVGVNNKPAYTNFTDVFDDPVHDAQFIWSSNLVLDNEVLVRFTVPSTTGTHVQFEEEVGIKAFLQEGAPLIKIQLKQQELASRINQTTLMDVTGKVVFHSSGFVDQISSESIVAGIYTLRITGNGVSFRQQFIIR